MGKHHHFFQVRNHVRRVGPNDLLLLPDQRTQDAVDEAGDPLKVFPPSQLNGFMHRGRRRHPVEHQQLVSTDPQHGQHARLDLGQRLAAEPRQGEIEPPPLAEHPINQFGDQTPVPGIDSARPGELGIEGEVGIGPFFDPGQDGKRQLTRIGSRQGGHLSTEKTRGALCAPLAGRRVYERSESAGRHAFQTPHAFFNRGVGGKQRL